MVASYSNPYDFDFVLLRSSRAISVDLGGVVFLFYVDLGDIYTKKKI